MTNTTPAYVVEESKKSNGVIVVGGSNWDLSRSAVETPVTKLNTYQNSSVKPCYCEPTDTTYSGSAYMVKDLLPAREPDFSFNFSKHSSALSAESKKIISSLPVDKGVILAGNSSSLESNPSDLASKRVTEVAKALKARGIKVYFTDSFGASRPATNQQGLEFKNSRVDMWVQVK